MGKTLATMLTMTTFGTWLRGDARGWVDDGVIRPPHVGLEEADRKKMRYPPFLFSSNELLAVGQFIGESLTARLKQRMYGITVQIWHVHLVVGASSEPLSTVVKCAKDAVRWGLRVNQPIWTKGYDKRYCFDEQSVRRRIEYVERHNIDLGLSARPWPFIELPKFG